MGHGAYVFFSLFQVALAVIAWSNYQKEKITNTWKYHRKDLLKTVFFWFFTNFFVSLILRLLVGFFINSAGEMPINQQILDKNMVSGGAVGKILLIFQMLIMAPILEEVVFRWLIFEIFGQRFFSIIISALLFGLYHWRGEAGFAWLVYVWGGFVIAQIYHKANYNLIYPIAFHFITNLIACFFMLVRIYYS